MKRLLAYIGLGFLAPLVLLAILTERDFKGRTARLFARLVSAVQPLNARLHGELHEWRSEIRWDDVLSWVMEDRRQQ